MNEMIIDAPLKILIEDLTYFEKTSSGWVYKINQNQLLVNKIHLQGEIVKTAGFSNEILILDDGTRKTKVTRTSETPGDLSWVDAGAYCSIVGTLSENGKLPHIIANKIARITNKILQEMWFFEVKELKEVLINKIFPKLTDNHGIFNELVVK